MTSHLFCVHLLMTFYLFWCTFIHEVLPLLVYMYWWRPTSLGVHLLMTLSLVYIPTTLSLPNGCVIILYSPLYSLYPSTYKMTLIYWYIYIDPILVVLLSFYRKASRKIISLQEFLVHWCELWYTEWYKLHRPLQAQTPVTFNCIDTCNFCRPMILKKNTLCICSSKRHCDTCTIDWEKIWSD